jgi:hypothetical protein
MMFRGLYDACENPEKATAGNQTHASRRLRKECYSGESCEQREHN